MLPPAPGAPVRRARLRGEDRPSYLIVTVTLADAVLGDVDLVAV
jgi:hypothetical protein